MKYVFRNGRGKINPQREHPDPGEKLNQSQFPHPPGQMKNQREDVAQAERPIKLPRADGGQFGVRWRIFRGGENRPEHRAHERRRADVKREPDGTGYMSLPRAFGGNAKPVGHHPRQG